MPVLDVDNLIDEFERDEDSRFQRSEPSEWKYRRQPKYCRKVKVQRNHAPNRAARRPR